MLTPSLSLGGWVVVWLTLKARVAPASMTAPAALGTVTLSTVPSVDVMRRTSWSSSMALLVLFTTDAVPVYVKRGLLGGPSPVTCICRPAEAVPEPHAGLLG